MCLRIGRMPTEIIWGGAPDRGIGSESHGWEHSQEWPMCDLGRIAEDIQKHNMETN